MLRVPMRDLRMLEPNFSNSYSAAILCRERCIVLHLEQVRLLITAEEVRFFQFPCDESFGGGDGDNQNQNRSHIPGDDESAPGFLGRRCGQLD